MACLEGASLLCISREAFEAALGGPLQGLMDAEAWWKDALALQREVLARKNTATGRLVQVGGSKEGVCLGACRAGLRVVGEVVWAVQVWAVRPELTLSSIPLPAHAL